jgi:hypothetical protein
MDVSRGDKNEEEMNRLSGTFDYSGSWIGDILYSY